MAFGDYDPETETAAISKLGNKNEGGYGNYAALDIWSKYEIEYPKTFSLGINPVKKSKNHAYVSFVAANKSGDEAEQPNEPIYTTVYQFGKANGAPEIALERNAGSLKPVTEEVAANAPAIEIDATNGKLNNAGRSDTLAQFNSGTVITIPKLKSGSRLTFSLYGDTKVEINGVQYGNGDTYTNIGTGDVKITAVSANSYIESITVVGGAFDETEKEEPEVQTLLTNTHVGLWQWNVGAAEFVTREDGRYGSSLYGSTISTGFITNISPENISDANYINWHITIPAGKGRTQTYIKEPGFKVSDGNELVDADKSLSANVGEAVLTDDNVQKNNGVIYPVTGFGADNSESLSITVRHKLPTSVSGEGQVSIGLIIDNLYAPESYITVEDGITVDNNENGGYVFEHGKDGTVTAGSHDEYKNNENNPYYISQEAENEELQ